MNAMKGDQVKLLITDQLYAVTGRRREMPRAVLPTRVVVGTIGTGHLADRLFNIMLAATCKRQSERASHAYTREYS